MVRGKPETFNRPDYNFKLEGAGGEPVGDERVLIGTRVRGAPLDLIVAEAMILANSTWGGWLAECGVPGIYRSQASAGAGRQGAHGHPARAACRHGRGAVHLGQLAAAPLRGPGQPVADHRLRAPRPHRRAGRALQAQGRGAVFHHLRLRRGLCAPTTTSRTRIERFWTLRWLEQNGVGELDATVMKDGLVRADTLPLVFRALGTESLPRGARVRVRLTGSDLLTLELHATLLARIEAPAAPEAALAEPEAEDESPDAGALRLAIDLDEPAADDAPRRRPPPEAARSDAGFAA